ncbi:unnamed protein product [Alternaria burnsii]|nr:unnamed protein product [Alternaria burnsii]
MFSMHIFMESEEASSCDTIHAQYTYSRYLQATLSVCTTLQSILLHLSAKGYKKRRTLPYHWRGSDSIGKCGRRHKEIHILSAHHGPLRALCQFLRPLGSFSTPGRAHITKHHLQYIHHSNDRISQP